MEILPIPSPFSPLGADPALPREKDGKAGVEFSPSRQELNTQTLPGRGISQRTSTGEGNVKIITNIHILP